MTYQDLFNEISARNEMDSDVRVSVMVEHEHCSSAIEVMDILYAVDRLVVTLTETQHKQIG